MKSLIHKTMMQYFLCTVMMFLLMAPMFYLLTKYFYAEDLIDLIESVEKGRGIPDLDLEEDIMAGVMLHAYIRDSECRDVCDGEVYNSPFVASV